MVNGLRRVVNADLCNLDKPPSAVLLHVQVEPLRLDLQHLRRQLLLLWLLTCNKHHTHITYINNAHAVSQK
jgi:hypothetical protein